MADKSLPSIQSRVKIVQIEKRKEEMNMKKFFAILLSAMLMLSLAVPAMAADETYTITINNKLDGHTYEAYQIFKGDLSKEADEDAAPGTNAVLSNIVWGDNIDSAEFVAALMSAGVTGLSASSSAIEVAEKLVGMDASIIAKCAAESLKGTAVGSDDYSDKKYEISDLNPGYYLVKDKKDTLDNEHDAYTRYIIEVVENSTVTPKSAFPTVDKQVKDEVADKDTKSEDSDGWGETADHEINESFQFKLIATLPADENFAAYETYKVVFKDSMSTGITFESIASVKVNNSDVATADYNCTATAGMKGGDWTLTIDNIKKYDTNLVDGATITVIYNAHLNEDAKIGNDDDNNNTVSLLYSNNPNAEGDGDLGETAPDTVWVFTYQVDVTKVDGADASKYLEGAEFKMKNADGKWLVVNAEGKVQNWVTDETQATVLKSDATGKFSVIGLDDGTYQLIETKAPAGYNLLDTPIAVDINATHAENENTITASTDFKVNNADSITVENNAGATLPETGGMGTTIFYIVGGVMVVAAVVLLVTKKRMSAEG